MNADDMSAKEKSTLKYIESCVVDKEWLLERRRMNEEDFENIRKFESEGLLQVERVPEWKFDDLQRQGHKPTHMVLEFSDEAWEIAHQLREEQAGKLKEKVDEIENKVDEVLEQ